MPSVATGPAPAPGPLVSQRIAKLQPDGSAIKCLFSDVASLTISRFLAGFIHLSDEIEFDPTAVDPNRATLPAFPERNGWLHRSCEGKHGQMGQTRNYIASVPYSPCGGQGVPVPPFFAARAEEQMPHFVRCSAACWLCDPRYLKALTTSDGLASNSRWFYR